MQEQLSIYDIEYEKFKINKPIRLIELFSGYGSQALALKYLGVNFEHWKTCEWAIKSIQAYKDIHFTNEDIELNNKFNGSGSTGKAVMYENYERNKDYKYIGIELTEEYLPISKARIEYVCNLEPQLTLFDYE